MLLSDKRKRPTEQERGTFNLITVDALATGGTPAPHISQPQQTATALRLVQYHTTSQPAQLIDHFPLCLQLFQTFPAINLSTKQPYFSTIL
jgi:hypothetical protein